MKFKITTRYFVSLALIFTACFATFASAQNPAVLATGTRLITGGISIGTGIALNYCKGSTIDLAIQKTGVFSGFISTPLGMKPVINYTIVVSNNNNCILHLNRYANGANKMGIKDLIGHLGGEYIPNSCTSASALDPSCTMMNSSTLFPNVYWRAAPGATLAPFGSITVSFSIISHELISQTNTACVTISNDVNQANNCMTINTPIPPAPCQPDLAINKVGTLNGYVSTVFGMRPLIHYTLTVINLGTCSTNLSGVVLQDQIGNYFGDYVATSCVNSPLFGSCLASPTPSGFSNLLWNGLVGATLPAAGATTISFNAISYEATSQTNSACVNIAGDTNLANNCMTIQTSFSGGYGYGNLTAGPETSFFERGVEAVLEKITK